MRKVRWIHPRHAGGIRSPQFSTAIRGELLTDKKIGKYLASGFYDQRAWYRAELRKIKDQKNIFQRLIYDCEKQDFL